MVRRGWLIEGGLQLARELGADQRQVSQHLATLRAGPAAAGEWIAPALARPPTRPDRPAAALQPVLPTVLTDASEDGGLFGFASDSC
jgi:hypothetical protein